MQGRTKEGSATEPFLAVITPVTCEPPVDGGDGPHPEHPIYFPPDQPEHPIVLPPEGGGEGGGEDPHPDHTLPGDLPHPDHTLPGDLPPEIEEIEKRFEIKVAWTAEDGWFVALIPTGEHVTPSKRR